MTQALRRRREALGLTQRALAEQIGLSRQSLNAIEAGHSSPSVAIALRLARALGAQVEALFAEDAREHVQAELAGSGEPGSRVVLGWLRERWVAHVLTGRASQTLADGFVVGVPRHRRAAIDLNREARDIRKSVLIGGCAPGLSLLAERLNGETGGGRFRWLVQSNAAALRALSAGHVHVAGVHMPQADPGKVRKAIARHLPDAKVGLYALAAWEAGLVVPKGNPRRIRDAGSLANPKLSLALREAGSGARQQLERQVRKHGVDLNTLQRRAVDVRTHMEVAYAVSLGAADVGFAIRAVALALDLDFVPLLEERFDLIVPEELNGDPRCVQMLEALSTAAFRRELDVLGYDASACGKPLS